MPEQHASSHKIGSAEYGAQYRKSKEDLMLMPLKAGTPARPKPKATHALRKYATVEEREINQRRLANLRNQKSYHKHKSRLVRLARLAASQQTHSASQEAVPLQRASHEAVPSQSVSSAPVHISLTNEIVETTTSSQPHAASTQESTSPNHIPLSDVNPQLSSIGINEKRGIFAIDPTLQQALAGCNDLRRLSVQGLPTPNEAEKRNAILKALGIGPRFEVIYRSEEQREALDRIMENRDWALAVVLSADYLNMFLYIAPACLNDPGMTLVVMHSERRIAETRKALGDNGIGCTEWQPGLKTSASIVLVNMLRMCDEFFIYALSAASRKSLRRVVITDCHLMAHYHSQQRAYAGVGILQKIPVPLVLLTTTLPRWMEDQLEMFIPQNRTLSYIRSGSAKPYMYYTVRSNIEHGRLIQETIDICKNALTSFHKKEKIVIYCRSATECETLALELDCFYLYSNSNGVNAAFELWHRNGGCLVTLTALGYGLDYDNIALVVHCGLPLGLLHFAQETGISAKADEFVNSLILLEQDWQEKDLAAVRRVGTQLTIDEISMRQFVTTQICRRLVLQKYLDGGSVKECSFSNMSLCDICSLKSRSHRRSLV